MKAAVRKILKSFFSILLLLSLAVGIAGIAPAGARTLDFRWSGGAGYTASGSVEYDEMKAPAVIDENGPGKTKILDRLSITFRDPSGREIARYDDVMNGVAKTEYFQFHFDTRTGELFGAIDLGGESAGEFYLKGIVNDNLSLFRVEGNDIAMDEDDSPEIVVDPA
jgi:hypothetical protein